MLKCPWKLRRGTRIRTNSVKARTASIPAPLGFWKPQDHPPLENCHAGRRATTYCRESAYRQLHFWDRNQREVADESERATGRSSHIDTPCTKVGNHQRSRADGDAKKRRRARDGYRAD